MSEKTFYASLKKFQELTEEKMLKVAQQSAQDVTNDAQRSVNEGGNLPIDTGFLRNSLATELNGVGMGSGGGAVTLALTGYKLGDTLRIGWTAEYARRINYGFQGQDSLGRTYDQSGTMYRDKAAAKWEQFVAANARRISGL